MYSTTIKSDGQLRRPPEQAPPAAPPPPPPRVPTEKPLLGGIPRDKLLVAAIVFLLLQNQKPDWLLLAALAYILL